MSGSSIFTLGFVPTARPGDEHPRVRRGRDRARAACAADRLPPDDLRRILPSRSPGRAARRTRGRTAVGRRDPRARAADGTLPTPRRAVGVVAVVVRRGRGDAHVTRRAELLPLAALAPLVGDGLGRRARRRVAAARRGRPPVRPAGRFLHPRRCVRVARSRGLLRIAVRSRPGARPTRRASARTSSSRRATSSSPRASRSAPTVRRRGTTSTAGA